MGEKVWPVAGHWGRPGAKTELFPGDEDGLVIPPPLNDDVLAQPRVADHAREVLIERAELVERVIPQRDLGDALLLEVRAHLDRVFLKLAAMRFVAALGAAAPGIDRARRIGL